jgi:hypothetical protein
MHTLKREGNIGLDRLIYIHMHREREKGGRRERKRKGEKELTMLSPKISFWFDKARLS